MHHITPGHSAAGTLRQALAVVGCPDEILPCPDDLSCGPIAPGDPASRAAWWDSHFEGEDDTEARLRDFWTRADAAPAPTIWFGRHSAQELAFFLCWTHRRANRPYTIIDVTGVPIRTQNDNSYPARAAAMLYPAGFQSLLGTETTPDRASRTATAQHWHRLRQENAPFRRITPSGLASAPIDHYDADLIAQATTEWQPMARVIGNTMASLYEPYVQVGDLMLLRRAVALVEAGKLLAEGDPTRMHDCRVRLPG